VTMSSRFVRRVVGLALLPAVGFSAVLLFAALLISLRLEKAVGDLIENRAQLIALQLTNVVEGGLRFGIVISDQSEAPKKMQSLLASDQEIQTIAIFDDTGKRLLVEDRDGKIPDLDTRIVKRVLLRPHGTTADRYARVWRDGGDEHVVMQVRDAIGSTGAVIWVRYSARATQEAFSATLDKLAPAWLVMTLAATLVILAIVWSVWTRWERHVTLAQAHLDEPGVAETMAAHDNPLPGVPLADALQRLGSAERELEALAAEISGTTK
jgi:hypothetical protein